MSRTILILTVAASLFVSGCAVSPAKSVSQADWTLQPGGTIPMFDAEAPAAVPSATHRKISSPAPIPFLDRVTRTERSVTSTTIQATSDDLPF